MDDTLDEHVRFRLSRPTPTCARAGGRSGADGLQVVEGARLCARRCSPCASFSTPAAARRQRTHQQRVELWLVLRSVQQASLEQLACKQALTAGAGAHSMLINKLRLKVLVQHLAYLFFCDSGLESLRACLTTCNHFSNRSVTSLTASKPEGSTQTQAGAAHLCLPKDHRARRARGTGVRRAWAQLFVLAEQRPTSVLAMPHWQRQSGIQQGRVIDEPINGQARGLPGRNGGPF